MTTTSCVKILQSHCIQFELAQVARPFLFCLETRLDVTARVQL